MSVRDGVYKGYHADGRLLKVSPSGASVEDRIGRNWTSPRRRANRAVDRIARAAGHPSGSVRGGSRWL